MIRHLAIEPGAPSTALRLMPFFSASGCSWDSACRRSSGAFAGGQYTATSRSPSISRASRLPALEFDNIELDRGIAALRAADELDELLRGDRAHHSELQDCALDLNEIERLPASPAVPGRTSARDTASTIRPSSERCAFARSLWNSGPPSSPSRSSMARVSEGIKPTRE